MRRFNKYIYMLFKKIKDFLFKNKENKEDFDTLYKTDQNIKSENYEIVEKVPVIKRLKKK